MGYWKVVRNIEHLARAPGQSETDAAVNTNRQIRTAILNDDYVNHFTLDVFLQGSYANSTNITGSSDIDVVAKMSDMYYYEFFSDIPQPTQTEVKEKIEPTVLTWADYRAAMLRAMQRKFAGYVEDGNKAIKVNGTTSKSRLDADVIPCCSFRMYRYNVNSYEEGICFFNTATNQRIVNFPKQHQENMSAKNSVSQAGSKFKGIVRAVKRLRNEIDPNGNDLKKLAASYWIESLLYNAPDSAFKGSFNDAFQNSLAFLDTKLRNNEHGEFMQPNEVYYLFHASHWNKSHAIRLVGEVYKLACEWVA